MRLRFFLETAVFRTLLGISYVGPRRLLLGIGSMVGWLGYVFDSRHRRIALDNLRLAYREDYEPAWGRRIVLDCWRHFGRIMADSMALYRIPEQRLRNLVEYEGLEHIRGAYAQGKGVLVFSGHFGHWELTAMMQGYLGLPLYLVARPLDNPALERLLARLRERSGNRIVHKRSAVREMLRAVREKKGVAIVIDQDARSDGVFVPFFGRPASTTPTLGLLAIRTGAVVVPAFSIPLGQGRYRLVYEPAVEVPSSGDRDRDVLEMTARCTAIIEKWVRRYPSQWLWMHRRWKTKPADD